MCFAYGLRVIVVCVQYIFSVNLLRVVLHVRCVFLCDLRMVGVSCLCTFHYFVNEPVVCFLHSFCLCFVCFLDGLCVFVGCSTRFYELAVCLCISNDISITCL